MQYIHDIDIGQPTLYMRCREKVVVLFFKRYAYWYIFLYFNYLFNHTIIIFLKKIMLTLHMSFAEQNYHHVTVAGLFQPL